MYNNYDNFTQNEKQQSLQIINEALLKNDPNYSKSMLVEVSQSMYHHNIARKGEMMFGDNALDIRDVANKMQDKYKFEVTTGQFGAGFNVAKIKEVI